eukprot:5742918-Amphidinium_carterae.2
MHTHASEPCDLNDNWQSAHAWCGRQKLYGKTRRNFGTFGTGTAKGVSAFAPKSTPSKGTRKGHMTSGSHSNALLVASGERTCGIAVIKTIAWHTHAAVTNDVNSCKTTNEKDRFGDHYGASRFQLLTHPDFFTGCPTHAGQLCMSRLFGDEHRTNIQ